MNRARYPVALADVVGHRHVKTLLTQAIGRGTLPPTLLLTGPTGVGKWRIAHAVAAALNCLSPAASDNGFDACGTCRSCERVARRMHVDVLLVEPDEKASIKIDVIRDVLDRTGFRPFEGRRRAVLIRDADTLEPQAQNALLKSLEEPPPSTVFILTTATPGSLLPTVLSRCMTLRAGRLSDAEVEAVLARDHDVSADEARAAAALADGSVGQALALGTTDLEILRETALALLQTVARTPAMAARLSAAGTVAITPARKERTREEVALLLRMAASMLRDVELLKCEGDRRALANATLADDLSRLTRAFAGDRARDAFTAIDQALVALERNAGTKVVAEWLATRI